MHVYIIGGLVKLINPLISVGLSKIPTIHNIGIGV